ncbi:ABC transporter ATP-binding protein/permease [Eubacterium limosum]|uniref:ABC transporter ATP-binding protein n=1 Tax=Eubacterium limosum TaxID=1736 RepID=A0ABT5UU61_EUBLI|nr:ABC transporter ATP-binding protein [Eubacterium limosum]MCB6569859.1 ABC transporter ATP-binding protein/permease [Eubacterium limosum]MDE1471037.1 ABC transporter ATP-binding protein [Eubacterium limosum]
MRKENKVPVIPRLWAYAKPNGIFLFLGLVCAIISIALSLWMPILIGHGVDYIVGPGQVDFSGVMRYVIILGVNIGVTVVFQYLMSLCTNQITYKTIQNIRKDAFEKFNTVPLKYIDSHSHGDLMSRFVNDIELISNGLLQGLTQLFTGVVTILGTLAFMLSINMSITVVVVLVTPLSIFVAGIIARLSYSKFKEQSVVRGDLSGFVEEMVGNQKVVTAFSHEEKAEQAFEAINQRLYRCGVRAQFYSSLTNPSTRFVNAMVYAAVGITGAVSVIGGGLSVGQLSSFLSYANQYTKPFNEVTGVLTEIQTAFASARRVFALLDERPEPSDAELPALPPAEGAVCVEHADFSYQPDTRLIKDLNITAEPGQRIALVGPTGCGKTTIINLLMGFYDVNRGSIAVDGHPVKSVTRSSLRGQYGMVLQDTWLFSGTIRENIAYGRPDATDEEILEASRKAYADSFIRQLEKGYDTQIAEGGDNLSQGQRQLLCIARVMLTKPPMLILDEATSSIDTRTEVRIQNAFNDMMKGRTSFVVAHRLSTIRSADTILVMNQGRIIERGNHETLLAQNGFYTKLYNSQFEGNE